jgi:hypothetical protein
MSEPQSSTHHSEEVRSSDTCPSQRARCSAGGSCGEGYSSHYLPATACNPATAHENSLACTFGHPLLPPLHPVTATRLARRTGSNGGSSSIPCQARSGGSSWSCSSSNFDHGRWRACARSAACVLLLVPPLLLMGASAIMGHAAFLLHDRVRHGPGGYPEQLRLSPLLVMDEDRHQLRNDGLSRTQFGGGRPCFMLPYVP